MGRAHVSLGKVELERLRGFGLFAHAKHHTHRRTSTRRARRARRAHTRTGRYGGGDGDGSGDGVGCVRGGRGEQREVPREGHAPSVFASTARRRIARAAQLHSSEWCRVGRSREWSVLMQRYTCSSR